MNPPRSGGSHYKIAHPDLADILTVPFKRPIKPIYISQAGGVSRRGSEAMKGTLEYPVIISPLSFEDGGGFAASVPDLPGCISDGETPEDALANVRDAIAMWLEAASEMGRPIPAPSPPKALA